MATTRSKSKTDDRQPLAQPEVEVPIDQKQTVKKSTILIAVVAIFLVAVTIGALSVKNLSRKTAPQCQVISTIKINPEKIVISLEDKQLELSALAYDTENIPIWQGVSYEWGISSSNSVGTLKQNNDLVTFTPLNKGIGDLFVKATNACTQTAVIGSVPVVVEPTLTPVVSP